MKKLLSLSAAAVVAYAAASNAHAQSLVGVQFAPVYNGGEYNELNNTGYAGAGGYTAGAAPQINWNVADGVIVTGPPYGPYNQVPTTNDDPITNADLTDGAGNRLTSGVLINSTGAATALSFSYTFNVEVNSPASYSGFNASAGQFQPNGNENFYLVGGGATSSTGSSTLTLAGLNPLDTYNLYAYVGGTFYAGSQTVAITNGSTTYDLKTDTGSLTGLTQSTATSAGSAGVADYVEFTGLTGSAIQTISLTGGDYTGLSGFQIQDLGAAATPEPSAIWLLSLGLLSVGFFVRRNRAVREI
jgi:hypothetical protein